jgi:hypothetical protein
MKTNLIILKAEKTFSGNSVVLFCIDLLTWLGMSTEARKEFNSESDGVIALPVPNTTINRAMNQDNLNFSLFRMLANKRVLQLILPTGVEPEAHSKGDPYGEKGQVYKYDGFHADLIIDEETKKPEAYMEVELSESDEAFEVMMKLPSNRKVELIATTSDTNDESQSD